MKKAKESAALPKHITLHHLESCNDISRLYMILNNLKNHMTKEHAANTKQKRNDHSSWKNNPLKKSKTNQNKQTTYFSSY